jgi:parallel beta-helix repeat protein
VSKKKSTLEEERTMQRLATLVFIIVVLGGLSRTTLANTYYVATNGSDSNSGSSLSPWRTLQYAVETISSGDTVIVRAGTYLGCRIRNSGQVGATKTLVAEVAQAAVINAPGPQNSHSSLIEIENGSGTAVTDWIIDGFEVSNSPHHGIDIRITDRITVRNCYVHHSAPTASGTGIFLAFSYHPTLENNESAFNSEHGIYQSNSGDNPTFRGNRSHDNNGAGIHMNGDKSAKCPCGPYTADGIISFALIENNVLSGNGVAGGSAINADGVDDSTFRNNLLFNNHAFGISLFSTDGAHGSSGNKVYNNTIVQAIDGRWCINIPKSGKGRPSPTGNIVKNNILYTERVDKGSIDVYSTTSGVLQSDYNVVVDRFSTNGGTSVNSTLTQWQSFGYDIHSFVSTASSLFVDSPNNNYHLKTGSPAANAGTNLSPDVTIDLDGVARPQGSAYDIGCYESF